MKYRIPIVLILGLLTARLAVAQDSDLRTEPGYLDLSSVDDWFDDEPWLEVNINGALLSLVSEASRGEDPELGEVLNKLKAIEVRGYQLAPDQFEDIGRRTGQLARQLEDMGWQTVVRVRDNEERVNVYLKQNGNAIAGLVVMVVSPDDDNGAIFVNLVGDINPKDIGRIGRKFDINPLEDISDYP